MYTLAQSSVGASGGTQIAKKSMAAGVYPLVVIGGIILLIVIFVLLAKMKRNDRGGRKCPCCQRDALKAVSVRHPDQAFGRMDHT